MTKLLKSKGQTLILNFQTFHDFKDQWEPVTNHSMAAAEVSPGKVSDFLLKTNFPCENWLYCLCKCDNLWVEDMIAVRLIIDGRIYHLKVTETLSGG